MHNILISMRVCANIMRARVEKRKYCVQVAYFLFFLFIVFKLFEERSLRNSYIKSAATFIN